MTDHDDDPELHRINEMNRLARWDQQRQERVRKVRDRLGLPEPPLDTPTETLGDAYRVPIWWAKVAPPAARCDWCQRPTAEPTDMCGDCQRAYDAADDPASLDDHWHALSPDAKRLAIAIEYGVDPWTGRAVTIRYETASWDGDTVTVDRPTVGGWPVPATAWRLASEA